MAIRQKLLNPNVLGNLTMASGVATPFQGTASVSTTSSFVFNPTSHGQVSTITLTNAITITFGAPTNIVPGAAYKLLLKAGDTAARTFAWNAAYKFPSAVAPLTSGTTTSGSYDVVAFTGGPSNTLIYDGKQAGVR